jgi:hypothetical protein
MDLLAMLVELPLQGFHRRCRVPGQPRSTNRKVFVATGALAVQPGFVVLGDLKMWLFHASSMAQSAFQFQMAKIQTAPLPIVSLVASHWSVTATITAFLWSIHKPPFVLIDFCFVNCIGSCLAFV